MTHQARISTVVESLTKAPRSIQLSDRNGKVQPITEVYGKNVFSLNEMSKMLPKPVFKVSCCLTPLIQMIQLLMTMIVYPHRAS